MFRKKMQRSCSYCSFSTVLGDGTVLCAKKGAMQEIKPCRRFRYDPLRRIPCKPKAPDFTQYEADDFSL